MKTEIAALCLSIKFKQDLHSPLQFFLFAVRESMQILSLFHALLREAMQYNCKYVVICVKLRGDLMQTTNKGD